MMEDATHRVCQAVYTSLCCASAAYRNWTPNLLWVLWTELCAHLCNSINIKSSLTILLFSSDVMWPNRKLQYNTTSTFSRTLLCTAKFLASLSTCTENALNKYSKRTYYEHKQFGGNVVQYKCIKCATFEVFGSVWRHLCRMHCVLYIVVSVRRLHFSKYYIKKNTQIWYDQKSRIYSTNWKFVSGIPEKFRMVIANYYRQNHIIAIIAVKRLWCANCNVIIRLKDSILVYNIPCKCLNILRFRTLIGNIN